MAAQNITDAITDIYSNGLAILDFEDWRPIFKYNIGSKVIYQYASAGLNLNVPLEDLKNLPQEVVYEFEQAAQ